MNYKKSNLSNSFELVVIVICSLFILASCEKEGIPSSPNSEKLYTDGMPYNADDYKKIPEYVSIVIHKEGYDLDTIYETGESYTGFSDPTLRAAIEGDLDGHVPENRKAYYLSYIDNPDFQKATTPRTARKILGGMAEGRYDTDEGKWIDPDNLAAVSQFYLDWVTNQDDKKLIWMQDENPNLNPGVASEGSVSSWRNEGPNGEDFIILRNSSFNDANPFNTLSVLVDEVGSSENPIAANAFGSLAQVMQGLASARLAQLYAANYGLEALKDYSRLGTRYTDYAALGFLNGWNSTPKIETALKGGYLNTTNTAFPWSQSPDANTLEEIIIEREGEGTFSLDAGQSMPPKTREFYSLLFGTSISNYDSIGYKKILEEGHTYFNNPINRYGYEKDF